MADAARDKCHSCTGGGPCNVSCKRLLPRCRHEEMESEVSTAEGQGMETDRFVPWTRFFRSGSSCELTESSPGWWSMMMGSSEPL